MVLVFKKMDGVEKSVLNQYVIRNVIQLEDNMQHLIHVHVLLNVYIPPLWCTSHPSE